MRKIILIAIIVAVAVGSWLLYSKKENETNGSIKVGILHSLTGTMAISEKAVVDATMFAIDQINEAGGVLGRQIEPVLVDGCSDWPTFAREAENLITNEKVVVVFGCWTSASRKTVKPIFEKHDHLLFYPLQYEGLEKSPNIVYTGAAPNQQITPAVKWCSENLGKKFFLVGSDYVFPRTANAIIQDYATALGAEVVGEEYLLLGSSDVEDIIRKIQAAKPDVILNTINGDSNIRFFEELKRVGITSAKIPVMSFSIGENELQSLGVENMVGNYACWNYFQSVDSDINRQFVRGIKKKYGNKRLVSDPVEAAFISVNLWSQAAAEAGSGKPSDVRRVLGNQSFEAPEGIVYIDSASQHIWKTIRIGKISANSQFDIVWDSGKPVQPMPFPHTRTKAQWGKFLTDLYEGWGQTWANPNK